MLTLVRTTVSSMWLFMDIAPADAKNLIVVVTLFNSHLDFMFYRYATYV